MRISAGRSIAYRFSLFGGSRTQCLRRRRPGFLAGSDTYGICSNRFLDKEFKTVRYELTVTVRGQNRFLYKEDSQLRMPGRPELFHPTGENTLTRVTG